MTTAITISRQKHFCENRPSSSTSYTTIHLVEMLFDERKMTSESPSDFRCGARQRNFPPARELLLYGHPKKCFVFHRPVSCDGGSVGRTTKKKNETLEGVSVPEKAGLLRKKAWLQSALALSCTVSSQAFSVNAFW